MRGFLKKAYVLAFFIHGDDELATRLVIGAAEKLEVAATAQAKRLYYRPVAHKGLHRSDARDARHRIWLSDEHLLQRLIYIESEPFERRKEQSVACDEEDLIVYFIKHLIRIALRRNCFYMAIGVSRLLHHYSTAETMQLYEAVAQDPVHLKDDYYYRSRKGVLMKELRERFGDLLHTYRSSHGEERFDTADQPGVYAELVRQCLTFFTPWATPCLVPDTFEGFHAIPGLVAHSARERDQAEVNRVHAMVHPECYARLIRGFGFEAPEKMLAVPQFFLQQDRNHGMRGRRDPPRLTDEQIEVIEQELAHQTLRRKSFTKGWLRINVDGVERARFDPDVDNRIEITIDKTAELVEVLTNDSEGELLLATYLITHYEAEDRASVRAVKLETGKRITFEIANSAGEAGNVTLSVVYRAGAHTVAMRLLGRVANKLAGVLPVLPFRSPALLLTLVLALFVFALIGLRAYLQTKQKQPTNHSSVTAASPAPANQGAVGLNVGTPTPAPSAPLPNRREEPKRASNERKPPKEKQTFGSTPNIHQPEQQKTAEITREPTGAIPGVLLGEVRKVLIDSAGDDEQVHFLVAMLRTKLANANVITVTEKPEQADAILKVTAKSSIVTRGQMHRFSVRALLINARGDTLWPAGSKGSGAVYSGSAEAIVSRLKTDLFGEILRARNSP